jgi:hypothetical protein
MTQFLLLHGEVIVFGWLIQCVLALVGGVAWVYGMVKYPSMPAGVIAFAYFATTFICAQLFLGTNTLALERVVLALTLPWNLIMPCFDFYRGPCRLSKGGAIICAELNAAALYYIVIWTARRK